MMMRIRGTTMYHFLFQTATLNTDEVQSLITYNVLNVALRPEGQVDTR